MSLMARPAPGGKFSSVQRAWIGQTVLIVAGGPSVTKEIVDSARGRCRAIAVNNSYEIAPWADAMYYADWQWWNWHKDKPAYKSFAGLKITIESSGERVVKDEPEVHVLHNGGQPGLSTRPDSINTGANSGYQALNIAFLSGASRILLLGYDMRFYGKRCHWHPPHPTRTPDATYRNYAKRFQSAAPQARAAGVDVVNCSTGSLIRDFRFSTVEAELSG